MRYSFITFSLAISALVACSPTNSSLHTSSSSSVSSKPSVSSGSLFTLSDPRVEIFAKDLPGARVMARDGFGGIWVSRPKYGAVSLLEMSGSVVRQHYDAITGLKNPHGLAFNPAGTELYVAEETSIKKYLVYSDAPVQTIATLPVGGRHVTRTIAWGPDDRLYVSIGSTCDVCIEKNPLHGTIISMRPDGTDQKTVATGLRNAVFFDWSYVDGQMYATEMGRDGLGDALPPDEINRIASPYSARSAVPHFGWPYCYGNRTTDTAFSETFDCSTTEPPHINLPAHVAPLGMAFIPEEGWPEEWWYDMLVAEHGSWNSTEKVGYKIIRIPLDAHGNPEGEPVDFLTGFLQDDIVKGRPVDLMIEPGGTLYITDDGAGLIYKGSFGVEM